MELYDLHSHSTASDGALSPTDLVHRAQQQGVTALALTDHDTINGLAEAQQEAIEAGIRLIPGIELSATWENKCLHIVGLGIDPDNAAMTIGIHRQQTIRAERAQKIAAKLEKKRIYGSYEAVCAAAGQGMITRSHFADFLVQNHYVSDTQDAFDKYLARGKPAFVNTLWAGLDETVQWINDSGGVAVLAHPLRYKLTGSWLNRTLTAFKNAGGKGIEVVTGRSSAEDIKRTHLIAQKHGLLASQGSDFHTPENHWVELGRLQPLPAGSRPIWDLL